MQPLTRIIITCSLLFLALLFKLLLSIVEKKHKEDPEFQLKQKEREMEHQRRLKEQEEMERLMGSGYANEEEE